MAKLTHRFKCTVTAFVLTFALTAPLAAQETDLDGLFQELIDADDATHARVADTPRPHPIFPFAGDASPSTSKTELRMK